VQCVFCAGEERATAHDRSLPPPRSDKSASSHTGAEKKKRRACACVCVCACAVFSKGMRSACVFSVITGRVVWNDDTSEGESPERPQVARTARFGSRTRTRSTHTSGRRVFSAQETGRASGNLTAWGGRGRVRKYGVGPEFVRVVNRHAPQFDTSLAVWECSLKRDRVPDTRHPE